MRIHPDKQNMKTLNEEESIFTSRFKEIHTKSKGRPFAFDHGDMRTLHFDERFIQSAMRISSPADLLLSYTKAMMFFLLVKPLPIHILVIGLGGGSLTKYCFRKLTKTKITVVELNADVIALRQCFSIPDDDARLNVINADAFAYLKDTDASFDVILHDGFDANGLAPALDTDDFYAICRQALAFDGILVSNTFGIAANLPQTMAALHDNFRSNIWWIDPIDCMNRIVFSSMHPYSFDDQAKLLARARRLDRRRELGLTELLESVVTARDIGEPDFCRLSAYQADAVFSL